MSTFVPHIAFIDDGVCGDTFGMHLNNNISISASGEIIPYFPDFKFSHGTTCFGILHRYFKEFTCSSVKILNSDSHRATPEALIAALEWCLLNNVNMINVSVGTVSVSHALGITQVVNKLAAQRVLIVAALSNSGEITFPASLSNVIGVKALSTELSQQDMFFSLGLDGAELSANSIHRLCTNFEQEFTTYRSNSFATPYMLAKICMHNLYSPCKTIDEIKFSLFKLVDDKFNFIVYPRIDWINRGIIFTDVHIQSKFVNFNHIIIDISTLSDHVLNKLNLLHNYDTFIFIFGTQYYIDKKYRLLQLADSSDKNIVHIELIKNFKYDFKNNNVKHYIHDYHKNFSNIPNLHLFNSRPIVLIRAHHVDILTAIINELDDMLANNDYSALCLYSDKLAVLYGHYYIDFIQQKDTQCAATLIQLHDSDLIILGSCKFDAAILENVEAIYPTDIVFHIPLTEISLGSQSFELFVKKQAESIYTTIINSFS